MSQPEFKQAFDAARPEQCTCSGLEPAARLSFELALQQGLDTNEAIDSGLSVIDSDCEGMKDPPEDGVVCFTGCGKKEKVCGHPKGPSFLLAYAAGITIKLNKLNEL